jgi:chromosome condensin MukBEF ATPase and DNA-binding subunit MukB
MATANNKTRCVVCSKERATLRCAGCLQEFCFTHLADHRQELNKQLEEIEVNRDLFRQSLTQQIEQPNNHQLIQQINQWEQKSFEIIRQKAEEVRQVILKSTNESTQQLEIKLNTLTQQLRDSRQENDFNEINLHQFQQELERLTNQLSKSSNVSIREDATSFISKISVSRNDVNFVRKGEN